MSQGDLDPIRIELVVGGSVQGVGFRPFVFRQATRHGLTGYVQNTASGVRIEVEGRPPNVTAFIAALSHAPSGPALVQTLSRRPLPPEAPQRFEIRSSDREVSPASVLSPDHAPCALCLQDLGAGRRRRYPMTTCATCGPRYSIVERLPFDRSGTAMRDFPLCKRCQQEYEDPDDRRFHAEIITCQSCGPEVRFEWLATDPASDHPDDGPRHHPLELEDPLEEAAKVLRDGRIVALMGVGGYQLLVDATDDDAVERLRRRKHRRARPLAVLFGSLEDARAYVSLEDEAERVLTSPAAPITLVPAREHGARLAPSVGKGSPLVGAMLPASPLHHLLAEAVGRPLVCTSGNPSGEPLCIDTAEARDRLTGVADALVHHDRRIIRPLDDSVVRPGVGPIRRARGLCPTPVASIDAPGAILALGAHQKSTVTLVTRGEAVLGPHLGDLESLRARDLLQACVSDLLRLFDVRPDAVACDLHPDYASTALAERLADEFHVPLIRVQHHHAHVAAVMADRGSTRPAVGLAWDGTGYGADGTIWGGEAIRLDPGRPWSGEVPVAPERTGHLRAFPLVGGDRAAREGFRAALGHASTLGGDIAPALVPRFVRDPEGHAAFELALASPRLSLPCSSVGRLFDAVAALSGLRTVSEFEGQAAMQLEYAALGATASQRAAPPYPVETVGSIVDTRPLIAAVLADARDSVPVATIAWRLHRALGVAARHLADFGGEETVLLSGGCFQNAVLLDVVEAELTRAGHEVKRPTRVPTNDGGISVGQALVAALALKGKSL